MGAKTEIAWSDSTWNPIRGCSMAKGSEIGGCLNCYAARLMARGLPGLLSADGKPLARIMDSGPRWTGKVELVEKALTLPLKWRKPKRIFVNSLSDLFHGALTDEQIDRVFAVMALCPQHTFQILTKRPERMLAYCASVTFDRLRVWMNRHPDGSDGLGNLTTLARRNKIGTPFEFQRTASPPLPNVWLGVSVENQATADARIPLLLQTPAAKRFVSYEPALGPVDFTMLRNELPHEGSEVVDALRGEWATKRSGDWPGLSGYGAPKLDWIIVGGESGPGARPFDIQWARQTVAQCKAANVAVFVKQIGAKPILPSCRQNHYDWGAGIGRPDPKFSAVDAMHPSTGMWRIHLEDKKGGNMAEWPEHLRVREFPKGKQK